MRKLTKLTARKKYLITGGNLQNGQDVKLNELRANMLLHNANRLHNDEMARLCNRSLRTIGNNFDFMFADTGIEKNEITGRYCRHDLNAWAITRKFIIRENGDWRINEDFLVKPKNTSQ